MWRSDSAQGIFDTLDDGLLPAPGGMPHNLVTGELSSTGHLLTVLYFEQIVRASVANEQVRASSTHGVQVLNRRPGDTQGGDDLGLIPVYVGCSTHGDVKAACATVQSNARGLRVVMQSPASAATGRTPFR